MRKITDREKILVALFLGSIFIVANMVGLSTLFRKQGELQSKLVNLRNERREAAGWLKEKEDWEKRKEWMDAKQPKLQSIGEANAAMVQALQNSARKHNITIVAQGFGDPVAQPYYQEISVKLTINGSLESMTQWLVELQQPVSFQDIPSLSMKTDNDPSKIVCDITVAKWFAPMK